MLCHNCGQEYNEELFPVCPFCHAGNDQLSVSGIIANTDAACIKSSDNSTDTNFYESENQINISNKLAIKDQSGEGFEEEQLSFVDDFFEMPEKDYYDIPIEALTSLSTRSKNALLRHGIKTVGDLISYNQNNDLSSIPSLGAKSTCEIECFIESVINKQAAHLLSMQSEHAFYKEYNFSARTINILRSLNIDSIESLCNYVENNRVEDIRGIGVKSINEIMSALHSTDLKSASLSGLKIEISPNDNTLQINNLPGLSSRSKTALMRSGIVTVSDLKRSLETRSLEDIEGLGAKCISEIVQYINSFNSQHIGFEWYKKELYNLLKESVNTDNYEVFLLRSERFTLQEIGAYYNVTRERIRQRERKFSRKISWLVFNLLSAMMEDRGYVLEDDILEIFANKDWNQIVLYWAKNDDRIEYLDFAECFVFRCDKHISQKRKLVSLLEQYIGDGTNLRESLYDIELLLNENGFSYVDDIAIKNLMQRCGYQVYGNYILKGSSQYADFARIIIKRDYPDGFKLHDENEIRALREKLEKECPGIKLPDSNRAFSSRLFDKLVLCGRGLVIDPSHIVVDYPTIEEIISYINDSSDTEFYYSDLFSRFEGRLKMMTSINNYHYLHGVLKYYYPDSYQYNYKDRLIKHGATSKTLAFKDKLLELVNAKGCPISRKDISMKYPGIQDISINTAVAESDTLISWQFNYIYSLSLIHITATEKNNLKHILLSLLKDNEGYITDALLFAKVKAEMPDFLQCNFMSQPSNLFYVCGKLFNDIIDCRRPHIVIKDLISEISNLNLARHYLGRDDILDYKEYKHFADNHMWADATTGIVFKELTKDYYRLNQNEYIKKNAIKFSDAVIRSIDSLLMNNLENGFISLINVEKFDELPEFSVPWTPYLIKSIIDNYLPHYKIIESNHTDRRYERGIITKEESGVGDYVDLIVLLMKEKGLHSLTENKMLSFLMMNNLTYKAIPYDLYNTPERIRFADGVFSIDN